jgi:hypothetical protein
MNEAEQILLSAEQQKRDVLAIQCLWTGILPLPLPQDSQVALWLDLYKFGTVAYAVRETAKKCHALASQRTPMTLEHAVRFLSRVASNADARDKSKKGSIRNETTL